MPKSDVVFSLTLAVFLFFLLSCASKGQSGLGESQAPGDIRIHDFGRVKEGEVLEHAFILSNLRDKPLGITSMHTSCGCTASETEKRLLLSGEHTRINVKFNTQGYSGRVQQHVYVHSDDTYEPIIKYTIEAEVIR